MDLDAYLKRIGWSGPVRKTAEDLAALAAHHATAIPFENLNPFLGLPVEIDIPTLERKLVRDHRGGYCFEQNTLFAAALRTLGFDVSGLSARVLWGLPDDTITSRGHMLLQVELDGQAYIADVGFGGLTLTGALRLVPDTEQPTAHEPFRFAVVDGDWREQAKVGGAWRSLYRFDLQRQYPVDYVVANHYTATHPASRFPKSLFLARPVEGRRYALLDRDFAVHHLNGPTERRHLDRDDEVIDVLETYFDIRTKGLLRLKQRLAELP